MNTIYRFALILFWLGMVVGCVADQPPARLSCVELDDEARLALALRAATDRRFLVSYADLADVHETRSLLMTEISGPSPFHDPDGEYAHPENERLGSLTRSIFDDLRGNYGGYRLFGGDTRFGDAYRAFVKEIQSRETAVSPEDYAHLAAGFLDFVVDAHFTISNVNEAGELIRSRLGESGHRRTLVHAPAAFHPLTCGNWHVVVVGEQYVVDAKANREFIVNLHPFIRSSGKLVETLLDEGDRNSSFRLEPLEVSPDVALGLVVVSRRTRQPRRHSPAFQTDYRTQSRLGNLPAAPGPSQETKPLSSSPLPTTGGYRCITARPRSS